MRQAMAVTGTGDFSVATVPGSDKRSKVFVALILARLTTYLKTLAGPRSWGAQAANIAASEVTKTV